MGLILGMDIGGTSIKIGAWNSNERITWQSALSVPDSENELEVTEQLLSYIKSFTEKLPEEPIALGIGSCGLIAGGVIFQSPNTAWHKLALVEHLGLRLTYPVFMINDADAFLMSALTTMVEKNSIALGITLGTGIGTAIWIGDRLFLGGAGISPEGGHITLGIDRGKANTGIPGTWESLASKQSLLDYYHEAGGSTMIEPIDIANAARRGDHAAISAWNTYGKYVGAGIGSLCNVLSPDYVLIGGGMSGASDLYLDALNSAVDRHMLEAMPRPDIHFYNDEPDSVAHGAAIHAKLMHDREDD